MSMLRSAIEEITTTDLDRLDDAGLEENFAELDRAADLICSERLRLLAVIEARGTYGNDGHLSITSWLAQRFRKSWSEASRLVRGSRALVRMPATHRALVGGEITPCALVALASARQADPQAFEQAEGYLVEAARNLSISDLRRVTARWRQAAEDARVIDPSRRGENPALLALSPTLAGRVHIDGDLDPEAGQTVITAVSAMADAQVRTPGEDARTPAQRRAEALVEICRQWLEGACRPLVGGERPHITVIVDLATLEARPPASGSPRVGLPFPGSGVAGSGIPGSGAELEDVGPIPAEAARRLACDASVHRVITNGASEPLDVGRRTQVVPVAIRRAVVVRDRGCRFPGCDRPPGWCEAHHVVHWAKGGPTSLSNLVLVCRRHHRLVHHGFGLEMVDGRPRFSRPDGTVLEERGPP
jgi:hypothetical protein